MAMHSTQLAKLGLGQEWELPAWQQLYGDQDQCRRHNSLQRPITMHSCCLQAFGVANGDQTPSGLSLQGLPQAVLVSSTLPVVNGSGAVKTDGLRVNGAAVKPVGPAPPNCLNNQPTGSGDYTKCAAAPTILISHGSW